MRADPDCIALHMRHPVVAIWDDGDLCDLATTDGAPGHDPDVRPKSPLRYSIVATYKGGALRMLNHGFKTHTAAEREVKVMEAVLDE